MDQSSSGFPEFSIFFGVPHLVEAMFPKGTLNGVGNVRSLAVETLE